MSSFLGARVRRSLDERIGAGRRLEAAIRYENGMRRRGAPLRVRRASPESGTVLGCSTRASESTSSAHALRRIRLRWRRPRTARVSTRRRSGAATSTRPRLSETRSSPPSRGSRSNRSTPARRARLRTRPRLPRRVPYTRGVHPSMYRGRLWTMRQFAGFGAAKETNERFKYPARARSDRASRRVRFPDADGLRLRPPALAGRGRASAASRSRRSVTWRRCSTASRSTGLDVDDDQRAGGDAASRSTSPPPRSRASRSRSCAAPSRTTS